MSTDSALVEYALAIADIVDRESALVDELEGAFLRSAGRTEHITPAAVARDTPLSREAAADLFRQLNQCNAIQRTHYQEPLVQTRFKVNGGPLRNVFSRTREVIETLAAHQERVPTTTVTPLVTFPEDPAFDDTSAAAFGMTSLMSALASEIKRCDSEIILLSPFFEGDGFDRLADVLLDALDRDVSVTIVTRYLADRSSHNYAVMKTFMERAREADVSEGVQLMDYTVWDADVPADERHQNGANPAFTLHAKVMVFDDRSVYVGSANVTDYGFDHYLELGVLLNGAKATAFADLCTFLLDSESAIPLQL